MTHPEDVVPGAHLSAAERDPAAPDADAAEQAAAAGPGYEELVASDSLEAPQWDALEQSRIVEYDDDYR